MYTCVVVVTGTSSPGQDVCTQRITTTVQPSSSPSSGDVCVEGNCRGREGGREGEGGRDGWREGEGGREKVRGREGRREGGGREGWMDEGREGGEGGR